jgi:hypothetical protein
MNAWQTFATGIDPAHIPALCAALLLPILVTADRARRRHREPPLALVAPPRTRQGPPPGPAPASTGAGTGVGGRVGGWLLGVSAAVHVGLPFGHHDDPALVAGFLGSGGLYGVLAVRAYTGRRWRGAAVPLILATLAAYLWVLAKGGEEPDQVGIATALVELVALGLCLVPGEPRRRLARLGGGVAFGLSIVVFGAATWVLALVGHGEHGEHGHAARAQAGVVMTPVAEGEPTPAELGAAADLAGRTKAALRRYTDIKVALAAGFRPTLSRTGFSVHLENKAYSRDGRVLDPEHPEELMYAIADGQATLLSAVYTMPYAGRPAPAPGGPLTRWHAHNACVSLLPPGIALVDPFGGCPALSLSVTVPQMMHVWVVDNPGGPYAESVPDAWTRAFNRAHGVPFRWN